MPSICWKFFSLQNDKKTVICKYCNNSMTYSNGSTSNMVRHVKLKHPFEYESVNIKSKPAATATSSQMDMKETSSTLDHQEAQPHKQPKLMDFVEKTQMYKPDSSKKKAIDNDILNMVVKDMQPLSIVENVGFRQLIQRLDPKYPIIARSTLTQLLPMRYQVEKEKLKSCMAQVNSVSVTTDHWTSIATDAYTTLTAHFIDDDWILHSPVLLTRSNDVRHTAENLHNELQEAFREFDIERKVACIVTDNARNITNAAKMSNDHHPCFAHTLNLAVKDAIKNDEALQSAVRKVKLTVNHFKSSTVATNMLRGVHQTNNTQFSKLKQDVDTRWNSTYDMLSQYVKQHDAILNVLIKEGKMNLCLSPKDIDTINRAIDVLQPFKEATAEMSAEKFTTISKVLPMIKILMSKVNQKKGSSLTDKLRDNMSARFHTMESSVYLQIATLLDPRFKRKGLKDEQSVRSCIDTLKQLIATPNDTEMIQEGKEEKKNKINESSSLWDDFDDEEDEVEEKTLTASEMEIKYYLECKKIERSSDPLMWWKSNCHALPRLSSLAKKYLATPATSVPSERIFSKTGELLSKKRSNLKKSNVDMIIFLNKNC